MSDKDIGKRIKTLRKAAGMTQKELAAAAGVTQGAITKYENGISGPRFDTAVAIAAALNVSAYDLIGAEKYNNEAAVKTAFDLVLDLHGYMIIYEEGEPFLVGKGQRVQLSEDLVKDFLRDLSTAFQVQIEILKTRAGVLDHE